MKELAEQDKKHHYRGAYFKIICCKTLDVSPPSPTICLFSPRLVSNWAKGSPVNSLTDAWGRSYHPNTSLRKPLFPHKVSFSLSSEYESKQVAPLSTRSCHSFQRKNLGECYTLPNIWAGSGMQKLTSFCMSPFFLSEDSHGGVLAGTTHISTSGQLSFQLLLRLEIWLQPYSQHWWKY